MNRPNTHYVCTECTDCIACSSTTSRRFHLGTATISISVTPFGHTMSITFPSATSPSLTSQFSMVSTCRRIGFMNTAVCPNAGKVRDQCCYFQISYIFSIRAPRSEVTAQSTVATTPISHYPAGKFAPLCPQEELTRQPSSGLGGSRPGEPSVIEIVVQFPILVEIEAE